MQLAIDSSTDNASLALVGGSSVVFELTWHCRENHSVELLSRLDDLMRRQGLDSKSLDAVFVAIGPGSFNGIRVGVTTAKSLAFSLGIPVVGISTLSVEALPHAYYGLPVCAVMGAGRGEIAAATYQMRDGEWQLLLPERITTIDKLVRETTEKTVFSGEYITAVQEELKSKLGEKAVIPSPAGLLRRAAYLAELGNRELRAGKQDNPAALQPLYLRRPAITEPKKPGKMPGRALKAVIFDMDGVIVDSGDCHYEAWRQVFEKRGIIFGRDDFNRVFGLRKDAIIKEFIANPSDSELKAVSKEEDELFRKLAGSRVFALPGAKNLMEDLKESGFKIALGSSGTEENVRFILKTLKIEQFFDAVTYGLEVKESKPSPELFLLAAKKLGLPPENCIVIEDAIVGIIAAKRGGMRAVAITTTNSKEAFEKAELKPDLIIDSLEEITIAGLEKLFEKD